MGYDVVDVIAVYRDGEEHLYRMGSRILAGVRNSKGKRPDKFHVSIDDRAKIGEERIYGLEMACDMASPYDYGERVVFA